ncbi:hypothetical protein E2C01_037519 [Portunus trituberculatus]|uniref:Uncharacterized protein n=1 Tax=Portunus trituberculatus TaxID=210409 RepID=A0A5B7FEU1_PORTR|nr:hypothetical protein [Portunus trituberculatus]
MDAQMWLEQMWLGRGKEAARGWGWGGLAHFKRGTSSLDSGQQSGRCNPKLNVETWNTMRQTGQDRRVTESLEWSAGININNLAEIFRDAENCKRNIARRPRSFLPVNTKGSTHPPISCRV